MNIVFFAKDRQSFQGDLRHILFGDTVICLNGNKTICTSKKQCFRNDIFIESKRTMSDILDVIKTRRSVRKYKNDMVPAEIIDKIIEAGTYAATGMDRQSPIILAVTDKELRDKLSKMNSRIMGKSEDFDPFYGAPVVLVVLADKSMPTYIYDGTLVMGNLMLEAHALGVDSCWIHRAKEEFESEEGREILKSLGIEGDYEGIGHCILGYVDGEEPQCHPRKDNWVYRA